MNPPEYLISDKESFDSDQELIDAIPDRPLRVEKLYELENCPRVVQCRPLLPMRIKGETGMGASGMLLGTETAGLFVVLDPSEEGGGWDIKQFHEYDDDETPEDYIKREFEKFSAFLELSPLY